MSEEEDSLHAWNRLNKENSERELLGAFLVGIVASSEPLDKLSSWLLAGTAATAAIYITSIDQVLPFLTALGYKLCGSILAISSLFGLAAKIRATFISIVLRQREIMYRGMDEVLSKHDEDEEKIREHAQARGEKLDTAVDFEKVLNEVIESTPQIFQARFRRGAQAGQGDPNHVLKNALISTIWQGIFTSCQVSLFIAFIVVALWAAGPI